MSTRMRTVPKTHREAGRGAVNRSNRELSDTRHGRVKTVMVRSVHWPRGWDTLPSPRAPMLGAPFGTRPAHVVQLRPVGVEQAVREGAKQPRSAAMEESVDLCFIHVSGPSAFRPFVALLQVGVLFIGAKHLCFEARSTRHR